MSLTPENTHRVHPGGSWQESGFPADAVVRLDSFEAEVIDRMAADFVASNAHRPLDDVDLLIQAEVLGRRLPVRVVESVVRFRDHGNQIGMLLVKALPVDALPQTPADGTLVEHWSNVGRATASQLSIMSILGSVVAYGDEKLGRLVQDICPVAAEETRQENTGSVLIELHTEDGFHPYKPDHLGLYCLRADHDRSARTFGGCIRRVLPRLPARCVEELQRPIFRIRLSSSFVGTGHTLYSSLMPVLSGALDDPVMCIDLFAMETNDEAGRLALDEFYRRLLADLVGVVLEPGDLLLIDNRITAHGRTAFRPRYDGVDRWLRRCFVVSDLRASRVMRPRFSRVLATLTPDLSPVGRG